MTKYDAQKAVDFLSIAVGQIAGFVYARDPEMREELEKLLSHLEGIADAENSLEAQAVAANLRFGASKMLDAGRAGRLYVPAIPPEKSDQK